MIEFRSQRTLEEHFAPQAQLDMLCAALKAPKTLHVFTEEEGADEHCQMGNMTLLHQVVFDWLDETLKMEEKEKDYERRIDHAAEFAHI